MDRVEKQSLFSLSPKLLKNGSCIKKSDFKLSFPPAKTGQKSSLNFDPFEFGGLKRGFGVFSDNQVQFAFEITDDLSGYTLTFNFSNDRKLFAFSKKDGRTSRYREK